MANYNPVGNLLSAIKTNWNKGLSSFFNCKPGSIGNRLRLRSNLADRLGISAIRSPIPLRLSHLGEVREIQVDEKVYDVVLGLEFGNIKDILDKIAGKEKIQVNRVTGIIYCSDRKILQGAINAINRETGLRLSLLDDKAAERVAAEARGALVGKDILEFLTKTQTQRLQDGFIPPACCGVVIGREKGRSLKLGDPAKGALGQSSERAASRGWEVHYASPLQARNGMPIPRVYYK